MRSTSVSLPSVVCTHVACQMVWREGRRIGSLQIWGRDSCDHWKKTLGFSTIYHSPLHSLSDWGQGLYVSFFSCCYQMWKVELWWLLAFLPNDVPITFSHIIGWLPSLSLGRGKLGDCFEMRSKLHLHLFPPSAHAAIHHNDKHLVVYNESSANLGVPVSSYVRDGCCAVLSTVCHCFSGAAY